MRSYSFAIQFTIPECPHLLSFTDTGNVNLHVRNTPPLFLSSNNGKYTGPRPDQINLRGHKERSITPFLVSFITNSTNRIFGISEPPPPFFVQINTRDHPPSGGVTFWFFHRSFITGKIYCPHGPLSLLQRCALYCLCYLPLITTHPVFVSRNIVRPLGLERP